MSCHINFHLVPQAIQVPPVRREVSLRHHRVLRRAGRQVHREQEATGGHAGLMQAVSIPVYIATHTFGCAMVGLSGFTPSMSVVTL